MSGTNSPSNIPVEPALQASFGLIQKRIAASRNRPFKISANEFRGANDVEELKPVLLVLHWRAECVVVLGGSDWSFIPIDESEELDPKLQPALDRIKDKIAKDRRGLFTISINDLGDVEPFKNAIASLGWQVCWRDAHSGGDWEFTKI